MDDRLIFFHRVLQHPAVAAMLRFLTATESGQDTEAAYLSLVREVYATGPQRGPSADGWQNLLLSLLLNDENPLTQEAATGTVSAESREAAAHDLRMLQQLYRLTGPGCRALAGRESLPVWPGWPPTAPTAPAMQRAAAMAAALATAPDWGAQCEALVRFYREAGPGLIGRHWCLRWSDGQLAGVAQPLLPELDDLVGLAEVKATVLRNTEQFVRGTGANNLLLYGHRGTGKSTMIRSLPARYGADGLRLVEVARDAMGSLPALFQVAKGYAQRFILFLDDLSFDDHDASYKAFKSMVEGGLEEKPANVLLYATSNRRHLLPERWGDRLSPANAEVHGQDAMEEQLSLADRFGITLLFPTPSQNEYLAIVEHIARHRGLKISAEELREAALRWVMWNNPRSGRAARQFVDDLAGRLS